MKKFTIVVSLLLAVSLLGGCGWPRAAETGKGVTIIGVILPITGPGATWGEQANHGAQIAAEEIGDSLQLIMEDSQYDAKIALASFEKLTSFDHIDGLISGGSGVTIALSPKLNDKKVVTINAGAVSPRLSGASEYLFNIVPLSTQDSKFLAEQAYQKLDYHRIAMISSNDEGSAGATKVFQEEFIKLGGAVLADKKYGGSDTDYRTQLLAIDKESPDAIFAVGTSLGLVIRQARELGIKQPFLSYGPFENPDNITMGGQAVEGVVYSGLKMMEDSPEFQAFNKRHRSKFNKEASLSSYTTYDCMKLLYVYLSDCKKNVDCVRNKLLTNKFSGLTSNNIIFNEKGEIQSAMQLKTVEDGQFVKYTE